MRSSLGIVAVFVLAVAGAFALTLAQRAYTPPSTNNPLAGASTRDVYVVAKGLDGSSEYIGDLPMGESQFLTVKGLVVNSEVEHGSVITPDGRSFTVVRSMQPGESYDVHVSLNNSSTVPQSAELTVNAPQSVTILVQTARGSAAAPEVTSAGLNHWNIVHSGEDKTGGPFDLTISVYSSRFLSQGDGRVEFKLKASEYIAQRPQLAGLVY